MSIKGVEELLEEMCGGRPPISTFGERLKEELAGVRMTEADTVAETPAAASQEAPAEPGTEPDEGKDKSKEE